MVALQDVARIRLGEFVRPPEETGTGHARVEVVLGYVVRHERGILLLDTGIGEADSETEDWYRPTRVPIQQALGTVGLSTDDVDVVVNCHLHFDHCGGNPALAGRPVVVQRAELELARGGEHTFPELVDFDGVRYDEVEGDASIWPDVLVLPTPGHTAGHQSVVVRCLDGTVVLAGQSHDHASDFTADALALDPAAGSDARLTASPPWLARLLELDPRRVLFAHDLAVWEP